MLKSLWKDPVWSAVIAAGIATALGAGGTYLLGLWPMIANAFGQAWHFLTASTVVYNWLLVLLGIAIIPTLLLLAAGVWALFAPEQRAQSPLADLYVRHVLWSSLAMAIHGREH